MSNWKIILIIISGLLLTMTAFRRYNSSKKLSAERKEIEYIQNKYDKVKSELTKLLANKAWHRHIDIDGKNLYTIYFFDANLNGTRFLHLQEDSGIECIAKQGFSMKQLLANNIRYDTKYSLWLESVEPLYKGTCSSTPDINADIFPPIEFSCNTSTGDIRLADLQALALEKIPSLSKQEKPAATSEEDEENSELERTYLKIAQELNKTFVSPGPHSVPMTFKISPEDKILSAKSGNGSFNPIGTVEIDKEGYYIKPYLWYYNEQRYRGKFPTIRFMTEQGELNKATLGIFTISANEHGFEWMSN